MKADLEHKTLPFLATKVDEEQGIVEHIVAVMGNVDLGGDVIHPGAFTKTIQERTGKIRVLDQHRTDSIEAAIGKPVQLKEIGKAQLPAEVKSQFPNATGALWARTQFLMDTAEGKGAFVRLRDGAIDEWSFGYQPIDYDYEERDDGKGNKIHARNLRTVKLLEYGPVLWGMNEATTTLNAKEIEAKPYPNEHACRLRDPGDFQDDSFRRMTRRSDGKQYSVIVGRLEGETTTTEQAYRYPKGDWTAAQARSHCGEHDGTFEAASEEAAMKVADFETTLAGAAAAEALWERRWKLDSALRSAIDRTLDHEDISIQEKLELIATNIDQYKIAFLDLVRQIIERDIEQRALDIDGQKPKNQTQRETDTAHKARPDGRKDGGPGDGSPASDRVPPTSITLVEVERELLEIASID